MGKETKRAAAYQAEFKEMFKDEVMVDSSFQGQENTSTPIDDEQLEKRMRKNAAAHVETWEDMAEASRGEAG